MIRFDLGTAVARLVVDASGVIRGTQQAQGNIEALSTAYRKNFFALRNISTAATGVAGTITAGFAASVKAAVDFQDAMAGVQRTFELAPSDVSLIPEENIKRTQEQLGELRKSLLQISETTPTTPTDLAAIAEDAGALGISGAANIEKFTKTIADMANVSDLTKEEAASAFARIANIMDRTNPQFDRMASATLELGRRTASTEPEIVNMARRIAGAGKTVGLTTDQVLSFSAALASVGVREEQGGSALSRTLVDIANAVSKGGKDLANFAAVAGVSSDTFAQAFKTNAAGATDAFVEGLGRIQDKGGDLFGVMAALGITEVRQRDAVLRLASAHDFLHQVLDIGNKAWQDNSALTEIAKNRYATVAAQLKILRNDITQAGIGLGQLFLPALKLGAQLLGGFILSLNAVPNSAKLLYAALAGLTVIISGLLAVGSLVIPMLANLRVALEELAGEAAVTSFALGTLTKASLVLTGVLAIATIAMAVFGKNSKQAADDTARQKAELASLSSAFKDLANGSKQAVLGYIAQKVRGTDLLRVMQDLKVGSDQFVNSLDLTGQGAKKNAEFASVGAKILAAYNAETNNGAKSENARAKTLKNAFTQYQKLFGSLQDGRQEAQKTGDALNFVGAEADDSADSVDTLGAAADEASKALDRIQQAASGYLDAALSVRKANLQVANSQAAYDEALRKSANAGEAYVKAQLDIDQANLTVTRSSIDVGKAEQDLADARENQQQDLLDLEGKLVDAENAHEDAISKVSDLQAEYNDSVKAGGSFTDKLRDATLKLRAAQLGLIDANQAVADSEWQINFLRQEGASDRDILEAQRSHDRAVLGQEQANADLEDSEQSLGDVRTENAKDLAKLDRDLASAQRDVTTTARDIAKAQKAVADQQDAIAGDTAYRDANIALQEAHIRNQQAIFAVQDATDQLHALQDGSIERDLQGALLNLQDAYVSVAKANADLQTKTIELTGKEVTASQQNQILGDQLIAVGNIMGGPLGTELVNLGSRLVTAGQKGDGAGTSISNAMDGTIPHIGAAAGAVDDVGDAMDDTGGKADRSKLRIQSWWDTLIDKAGEFLGVLESVPGKLFGLFGDALKFTLTHLAVGGIIKKPTVALVGEAGPELVLPLSNIKRAMQLLQESGLMQEIQQQQGQSLFETAVAPTASGRGGDVIHISTVVQDAQQIAQEIAWRQRVRRRA